jgi:hypothetical protein
MGHLAVLTVSLLMVHAIRGQTCSQDAEGVAMAQSDIEGTVHLLQTSYAMKEKTMEAQFGNQNISLAPDQRSFLSPTLWSTANCLTLGINGSQKRIALLLRGHSYPNGARASKDVGKFDDIQNEVLENYRINVIEDLCQKHSVAVDVFIATAYTKFTSDLLAIVNPVASSLHDIDEEVSGGTFHRQSDTYRHLIHDVFEPYRQQHNVSYEYIVAMRFDTPLKDGLASYMDSSTDFRPGGFNFPWRETWPDWKKHADVSWHNGIRRWWTDENRTGDMIHIWHPKHTEAWLSTLKGMPHDEEGIQGIHTQYNNLVRAIDGGAESIGFLLPGFYSSVAQWHCVLLPALHCAVVCTCKHAVCTCTEESQQQHTELAAEHTSSDSIWQDLPAETECFNPLYRVVPREYGITKCLHRQDFSWDEDLESYWCNKSKCGYV